MDNTKIKEIDNFELLNIYKTLEEYVKYLKKELDVILKEDNNE